ncbi:MAG: universal stress protein F [Cocleimonas sp.]|jgi:universal stress protein F
MYNTILIPTDLSDEDSTIETLKKAEQLSNNGRVELLHVLDAIPAFSMVELPIHLMEQQLPKAREKLSQMVEKSGVKADTEVRKGQSYSNIVEEAKKIDANLIFINSHQPGLQDYLLGSTAAKVVRHAPCSVLVAR